jgi:oligopeptide/dipeptide ABC transporter ATP-binding protein
MRRYLLKRLLLGLLTLIGVSMIIFVAVRLSGDPILLLVSPAVDGVNFSIPKGTCFGIAGESGSGKTTINKLIFLEANPSHPYTKGLLQSVPRPIPRRHKERPALYGEIPNPLNPPMGCRFGPRCEERLPGCDEFDPPLARLTPGHMVACRRLLLDNVP